jgi:hypothetical protein
MKTKFLMITAFVLAALVLSGCTMGILTKINADGSGELGFVYKFTKSELETLSGMGASADTICTDVASSGSGVGGDVELKQEKHGDETWCVGSQPFATLDELRTQLGGEGFALNTLEIVGDKFTFDADIDMSSASTDMEGIPFDIKIQYELTAPGKVNNHNGDKKDGTTVIWDLSLTEPRNLHVESSTKGGSSGGSTDSSGGSDIMDKVKQYWYVGVIVVCCCLLVIIVGVVVFITMRRKKPAGMA